MKTRDHDQPSDLRLIHAALPKDVGIVIDFAPIPIQGSSRWLLVTKAGLLIEFDAETRTAKRRADIAFIAEPDHDSFRDHDLKPRLHVSAAGNFAAVVNDYGRYGEVIDLRTAQVTLKLDGGNYHSETVPFSFAFAEVKGRTVAIHRTDWNRLDVSDPATGELLTAREPTAYQDGEPPPHYLDYFHGGLQVSPGNLRIVDDGWVWHPVGVLEAWNLDAWIFANVWESESGSSRLSICCRTYYWDHAITWIDDDRIAVGGIGDDDRDMIAGARIFDLSRPGGDRPDWWISDRPWPLELNSFEGPAGTFFSDGVTLYSADDRGLSTWDIAEGHRTAFLAGFNPSRQCRERGELAQFADGILIRAKTGDRER